METHKIFVLASYVSAVVLIGGLVLASLYELAQAKRALVVLDEADD